MQFEVHGNDWSHLWTEDTRLAAVILMLLIVCLNLFFPLGKAAGEIKNKSS